MPEKYAKYNYWREDRTKIWDYNPSKYRFADNDPVNFINGTCWAGNIYTWWKIHELKKRRRSHLKWLYYTLKQAS